MLAFHVHYEGGQVCPQVGVNLRVDFGERLG